MSSDRSQAVLTTAGLVTVSSYVAAQMLADIMSLKIAMVGGISVDAGTFIYPITFTLRDLVHKLLGKQATRVIILAAAVINLIMAGLLAFTAWLPPDPTWHNQAAFAAILGPTWRIVVASIIAEVFAELTDTEVYSWWVNRVTRRFQWSRVLMSNLISVPLDSLIFSWLAFGQLGGMFPSGLPMATVWAIFWANVLIKGAVTLVSLPTIYLVPAREQQH